MNEQEKQFYSDAREELTEFAFEQIQDFNTLEEKRERFTAFLFYAGELEAFYLKQKEQMSNSVEEVKSRTFLTFRSDGTAERTSEMEAKRATIEGLNQMSEYNYHYKRFRVLKEALKEAIQNIRQKVSQLKQEYNLQQFVENKDGSNSNGIKTH